MIVHNVKLHPVTPLVWALISLFEIITNIGTVRTKSRLPVNSFYLSLVRTILPLVDLFSINTRNLDQGLEFF